MKTSAMCLIAWLVAASAAAQPLPAGQIIDRVPVAGDASQTYALFLPAGYTPDHSWPVIFAFDPGGRGRTPVERYQAAAARYGFIVAGSNNSRNGSSETGRAVASMTRDVLTRFNVNHARVYFAGMSGGSRVALAAALGTPGTAGVMASSAGYPDSQPRKAVPFPVFATAGTEDFNHIEMRQLDAALTTPHHLEIFNGGHTWLSSELAVVAVQWMEVQAMKSGLEPRNEKEIDEILAARVAAMPSDAADAAAYLALQAIVTDFAGLRNVSSFAARAATLGKSASVRAAIKRSKDEDNSEVDVLPQPRDADYLAIVEQYRWRRSPGP
jgi:poly(3-hydroxybutyrate) depolymerase